MNSFPQRQCTKICLLILFILSLNHCGKEQNVFKGNWITQYGTNTFQQLNFQGKSCIVREWTLDQRGTIEELPYQRNGQEIIFSENDQQFPFTYLTFQQDNKTYIRFLLKKQTQYPEAETITSTFLAGLLKEPIPLTYVAKANYVQKPSKDLHPFTGMWTQVVNMGETNRHITFKKEKGWQLIIDDEQKKMTLKPQGQLFQLTAGNTRGLIEFIDENIFKVLWLKEDQTWPEEIGKGELFKRRSDAYSSVHKQALDLGKILGVNVLINRPNFFKRTPGIYLTPIEEEQNEEMSAFLEKLEHETQKYQEGLIAKFVHEIILLDGITSSKNDLPGIAQFYQRKPKLFLNIKNPHAAFMFHHYFFQLMDTQYNGDDRFFRQVDWLAITQKYQLEGSNTKSSNLCDSLARGYVSNVGLLGYGSDRGQIFASLINNGSPCLTPQKMVQEPAIVDKIYRVYYNYKELLEPTINHWIQDLGLPDKKQEQYFIESPSPPPEPITSPLDQEEVTKKEEKVYTYLTIDVTPGNANIFINGQARGKSSKKISVRPGTHQVRIEKDGYKPQNQTISIKEGQHYRGSISLEAQKAIIPEKVTPTPAPQKPTRTRAKNGSVEVYLTMNKVKKNWKKVRISIGKHSSRIEYDNNKSNILSKSLAPGTYEFNIENLKFKLPNPLEVSVSAGKVTKIEINVINKLGRQSKDLEISINGAKTWSGEMNKQ